MILAYSAKKNKAKVNEEYSTLYPDTNSDSASGKSKGTLFVSAKAETKNNIKTGHNTTIFHIFFCASIIVVKLYEPTSITTNNTIIPIDTS
jgi:hypothetical protein